MRKDFPMFLCLIFAEGCTFKDSGSYVDQSHKFKKTTHKIQDPNYKIPIQNSSMWKGVHLHRQWVRCGGSSETLTPSICVYPALGHNNIDNKCTNTTVQKYKYKQRSYETLTLLFVFIRLGTTRPMANEQIQINKN